jgi:uncharacterized protein YjbI with pentapeptide repeats
MFATFRILRVFSLLATFALLATRSSHADIYQWEWIDPTDPSKGKQQSTTLCPDGAGVDAGPNQYYINLDLTQAYLIGAHLNFSYFSFNNLSKADLSQADLTGAYFESVKLNDAVLSNSIVMGADFSYSTGTGFTENQLQSTASYQARELTGIRLRSNDLSGWNFYKQNLANAEFTQSDLTAANFARANLYNVYCAQATLDGANFYRATIRGDFADVSAKGANFVEAALSAVYFYNANLTFANFSGADLSYCSFYCSNLKDTSFADANIEMVDFSQTSGFTEAQLQSTASYRSRDLTGIQFRGNDLSGWDFHGLNLTGAQFNSAKLANTIFSQTNLCGSDFSQADLSGAVFDGANIQYSHFSGMSCISQLQLQSTASYQSKDLTGIAFDGCDLRGWDFHGQNLTNARMSSSNLEYADFSHAILAFSSFDSSSSLVGVNFEGADFQFFANFSARDLTNANFSKTDLFFGHFSNAKLVGCNFADANVSYADFSNTTQNGFSLAQLQQTASYRERKLNNIKLGGNDLTAWDFRQQELGHADFSSSNLTRTDFTGANLYAASLRSATLSETIFTDANIQGVDLADATSHGFTQTQLQSTKSYRNRYLSGVRFDGNDLRGWDFQGCDMSGCSFGSAELAGANFTNADVRSVSFNDATSHGFKFAQLQSTSNYRSHNLFGMQLENNDLSGWDISDQNLAYASFYGSRLQGAIFTNANIIYANFNNVTSQGFTPAQLHSTASYRSHDLTGIRMTDNDLTGWNFRGQKLQNAYFDSSSLNNADFSNANLEYASLNRCQVADANFTNAVVRYAHFCDTTSRGFTQVQLKSTASYQQRDLAGIELSGNDMTGWDFNSQNMPYSNLPGSILSHANFANANLGQSSLNNSTLNEADFTRANLANAYLYSSNLTNAKFTEANLMNVDFNGAIIVDADFSSADTRGAQSLDLSQSAASNAIRPDGNIQGLDLLGSKTLVVRNYVPNWYLAPTIPINIQNGINMGDTGTLQMVFDNSPWNSTISFSAGIPVDRNGNLELTLLPEANPLVMLGQKCKLFDWTGVNPTGTFKVTSNYSWDTSKLDSTGEVALAYSPNLSDTKWTGKVNSNWNNAGNWTAGIPTNGKVIEFSAATPGHLPFMQNLGTLDLKGILFGPDAGSHYLGGAEIRLGSGDSSGTNANVAAIVCMSKNDQFIGNSLVFDGDMVLNVSDVGILYLCGTINEYGSSLTKRGSGTVVLESYVYAGGTTAIESGVLALDEMGQLQTSSVANEGTFRVLAGDHSVTMISGGGRTEVLTGSLSVTSIVQDSLIIGGMSSGVSSANTSASVVPEPGTIWLLAFALIAWGMFGRRRLTRA